MDKATDKQVCFLIALVKRYYDNQPEKRETLLVSLSHPANLTKRDASKAIDIMKKDVDIQREAWAAHRAGRCKASDYYAAHIDIYDDSNDKELARIWATI